MKNKSSTSPLATALGVSNDSVHSGSISLLKNVGLFSDPRRGYCDEDPVIRGGDRPIPNPYCGGDRETSSRSSGSDTTCTIV